MSASDWSVVFHVDGREFVLKFHHNEFILSLKPQFKNKVYPAKFNAWLSFADEPTYEDVNESINAFQVMLIVREKIVAYVRRHAPAYFYFHASTPRKAKIYPRFTARLVSELPDYCLSAENGSFYFYRQT